MGEAERARGASAGVCAGTGGSGRLIGGSGSRANPDMSSARFEMSLVVRMVVGTLGKAWSSVRSSYEACTVISWDLCVEPDELRECEDRDDRVATSECSDGVSSPSECAGVSTSDSSWIDSGMMSVAGLEDMVNGRMTDHGGDCFMRSTRCNSEPCASHSFSLAATQGFWVQRSLEKYALQA
jgi:hypothetical protein